MERDTIIEATKQQIQQISDDVWSFGVGVALESTPMNSPSSSLLNDKPRPGVEVRVVKS